MRIRKNSKLIVGGITNSSASSSSLSPSSFLVCQLNRSPWDVLDPFSLQGELDDSFESVRASDSLHSGESMELSFDYVEKSPPSLEEEERENCTSETEEASRSLKLDPKTTLSANNKRPPPAAPKRRGRPKKAVTTSAAPASNNQNNSNPYEFYYYSGFGPKWAKRRGSDRPIDQKLVHCNFDRNDIIDKKKTTEKEEEEEGAVMVDEELDYIDDDDDDEHDEGLYGGRRGRKPIKARSLKSLM